MASRLIACVNFRPFSGQPSCAFRGSRALWDWLEAEIRQRGLDISIERTVCMGHCEEGPNIKVHGGDFIHHADKEKLTELLDRLEAEQTQG
jgi:NADH:ubiquinone oxidoreductase subunit E